MVGVPKSKGCSTCTKRKIKCDLGRPSCLRCTDAKFSCPGYVKVHKFQDEGVRLRKTNILTENLENKWRRPTTLSSLYYRTTANAQIRGMISNPAEKLGRQLRSTFQLSLPNGKSLCVFGFVKDVPSRLGYSKAVDLSVEAIYFAHRTLLREDVKCLEKGRISYGRALVELRRNLARRTELLTSSNDEIPFHHIGGASAILERHGVRCLEDVFTCKMLKSLKGIIVIEAITLQKKCFLDSPRWKKTAEIASDQPFDSLFAILYKLPNILFSLRDRTHASELSSTMIDSTLNNATNLREEMTIWRRTPAYQESFETTTDPLSTAIIYTSNRAAALLCTYAAMSILINGVVCKFSGSAGDSYKAESRAFAEQIFNSQYYSLGYAPLGNSYMNFAIKVAKEFQGSN
ncbi:Zn2/Cys6 DNA-binding protein [Glarea lozoyensis ATCC 20868]|uniref:Zn2/Cys6 DNA-binding protein n=1 Tax=Glarea lozoyensis (strain ATCC 20868 / MF5171) TaxID=1116229 RepID=S3D9B0_GLAL2|nr:Zn2/Cys6 DNA-binding protein [Glarea lozoyensis ATCC 20868]EPE34280.1 Zn2/Cys6 DNA-binding protein [Glarea lozoyensis ATCC 20868]